jgi:hypothetical protein
MLSVACYPPRCAHGAGCLQPGTLLVPHQRHAGIVHQDGCHPGIGLQPLLRAVLAVRVPVCSGVRLLLPSAASAQLRALAPLMRCPHQRLRPPVLGSFAGGTSSLLSVFPLPSGVDGTRHRQFFPLFPTDSGRQHASPVTSLPLLLLRSGFRVMLAVQVCSLEPTLSVALHVSQRDLRVVKPELGTCRFLLGFFLSPLCTSPYSG